MSQSFVIDVSILFWKKGCWLSFKRWVMNLKFKKDVKKPMSFIGNSRVKNRDNSLILSILSISSSFHLQDNGKTRKIWNVFTNFITFTNFQVNKRKVILTLETEKIVSSNIKSTNPNQDGVFCFVTEPGKYRLEVNKCFVLFFLKYFKKIFNSCKSIDWFLYYGEH